MGHRAAIYCRVSTADQSCERQEFDLRAFAGCAGYDVVGIFKETGSGTKLDRAERKKVLALAQSRQIGVLGIFRPKTTKCSGGPAVCGLQRGITFFEIPIWALFE
ncbi:recombinase family protein [Enterobacter hormaechei]|uniref:recombinase family protein n=1 Tax=Enterobacter hormaechei TaxID=158836 RepID=UPI0038908973